MNNDIDAARWRWLANYLVSTRIEHDNVIVLCSTAEELGAVVDQFARDDLALHTLPDNIDDKDQREF